jgi:hypothetical protein
VNLHAIAAPYVSIVNPMLPVTLYISAGSGTSPDGTRVPSYAPPRSVLGQVQALTYRDLIQISGLNLNGNRRAIYLLGDVEGVMRPVDKGGDLIVFPDGTVWLVATALETWGKAGSTDTWCKVAATLQVGTVTDAIVTSPPVNPMFDLSAYLDTTSGPITYPLPRTPRRDFVVLVKDIAGHANTNHITISTVDGTLIDLQSTAVIDQRFGAYYLVFNSVGWSIT